MRVVRSLVVALAIHAMPVLADEVQTTMAPGEGETTKETSVVNKVADGKVCVMLKPDSFEIWMGGKSLRRSSHEPVAYLICDNATTASAPNGVSTLKCTNCTLTLPNGITATACEIAYDAKSNLVTLVGTEETPVSVKMADTESKCPKLEMKINLQAWDISATKLKAGQVLGTIGPARPSQSRY